ncbi:6-bladed beta-propeller [Roseivirga sp. UBA838]|uniref:6-bladed beta-propeller n=1 Tax=Roseivirga sp. UBA838 TaxID=1947393 RepID=UPI00257DE906|nr:6-bladed beta-propeller [Roseivirga sp. UBA838]|tara:strand:+ start:266 stop:1435 length:1170 start_codon:yes stop_codon:yes gene_type:complete
MRNGIALFALLILLSCSSNNDDVRNGSIQTDGVITFNMDDPEYEDFIDIEELLDTVIMIPLSNEVLIGQVSKILGISDRIFVFDEQSQSVFIYNLNGDVLNVISDKGEGPGQYFKIADIDLDIRQEQLIIFDQFKSKLFYYDLDGNFIKENRFYPFARFLAYNPSDSTSFAIFNNYNELMEDQEYNLFTTNESGTLINRYFPYEGRETRRIKDNYLTRSNEELFYIGHYDNKVYKVDGNEVELKYEFDFGDRNIPKSVVHDSFDSFEGYVWYLSYFYKANDYLTFSYVYNKTFITKFANLKQGTVIHNKLTSSVLHCYAQGPVKGVLDDYFISVVNPSSFLDYIENGLYPKQEETKYYHFVDRMKEFKPEDNPVVFLFKFKSCELVHPN